MGEPRVLLLSRRAELADALEVALSFAGMAFVGAGELEAAASVFRDPEERPGGVLVDLRDFAAEANEVCDALRAAGCGDDAPILLIGPPDGEIASTADALMAGGDGFFPLPVEAGRVLAKFATYMGLPLPRVPASLVLGGTDEDEAPAAPPPTPTPFAPLPLAAPAAAAPEPSPSPLEALILAPPDDLEEGAAPDDLDAETDPHRAVTAEMDRGSLRPVEPLPPSGIEDLPDGGDDAGDDADSLVDRVHRLRSRLSGASRELQQTALSSPAGEIIDDDPTDDHDALGATGRIRDEDLAYALAEERRQAQGLVSVSLAEPEDDDEPTEVLRQHPLGLTEDLATDEGEPEPDDLDAGFTLEGLSDEEMAEGSGLFSAPEGAALERSDEGLAGVEEPAPAGDGDDAAAHADDAAEAAADETAVHDDVAAATDKAAGDDEAAAGDEAAGDDEAAAAAEAAAEVEPAPFEEERAQELALLEREAAQQQRELLEMQAQKEAEARAREEAEERAREEAEARAREEAEERAREQARAREEAEARIREAEARAREAEERAREEAEARVREAEEKARLEIEELARREAEEKARLAEEKARLEQERAQKEAEARAREEAEAEMRAELDALKRELQERARQEAAERERLQREREEREAQERARKEAEEQARREAEERAQKEAEALAEQRAREAEERARKETEAKARKEAKALARQAEERARKEAEARARAEAEARIREAEERARKEAEEKARLEIEELAAREAEEKARLAEERARLEAERAQREVEELARREADEKARLEAEERARRAEELAAREAEERKRLEEERARLEEERRLIEEEHRLREQERARLEAEERARREEEQQRLERERAQREEEERARRDAEEHARREAEERLRQEAEARAREAEERAQKEAEARIREAEERLREAEERARKEAEQKLQEAAEEARKSAERAKSFEEIARKEAMEKARLEAERARLEEERAKLAAGEQDLREAQERAQAELAQRLLEAEERFQRELEQRVREQEEAFLRAREAEERKRRSRFAFQRGLLDAAVADPALLEARASEVGIDGWEEGAREGLLPMGGGRFEPGGELPMDPPRPPEGFTPLEPLEGSFSEGELPALLWSAHTLGVTGAVTLRHKDGRERTLLLEAGEPVGFVSTLPQDRPEEALLRAGLITAARHAELRSGPLRSARRTCAALVDEGALKPQELFTAVRGVLTEQVLSVLEWDEGTFAYAEERAHAGDRLRLQHRCDALLAEGIRRKYDEGRLLRVLGGPQTLLAPDDRALELPPLAPEERVALRLFDGTRPVEDVVLDGAISAEGALRAALILVSAGALRIVARGLPRDADRESEHERSVAIDKERILDRLHLARHGDYFAFLGVPYDVTAFEVHRAADRLRRRFDEQRYSDPVFRELREALREIRQVADEAEAVLSDEALKSGYRRNLSPLSPSSTLVAARRRG